MKKATFTLFLSMVLLYSCKEQTYSIKESDLDDMYSSVEDMEYIIDSLLSQGHANKDGLLELKDEIDSLHSIMDETIYEDEFEPAHMR
jgi:hypothetical protein